MTSYNLSTVSKVEVFKKRKNKQWIWKPKRKFLGIINLEAGFYNTWYNRSEWNENPPQNCYLENGIVYKNPYFILTFTNGHSNWFNFESVDKMMRDIENIKIKTECKWYED